LGLWLIQRLNPVQLSGHSISTDGYSAQSPYGTDVDDYEDDAYKNRTIDLSLVIILLKMIKLQLKSLIF